jgi:type III restriction enzyme
MPNLHHLLNDIPFEALPPAWTTFDLASFSRERTLWDYQQDALSNAIKALWKYHDDFGVNKQRFMNWYLDNQVELEPEFNLGKKRENASLLNPYYPITESRIPYSHFINRMGFWMATGSGKTLVIVKMLELLWTLIQHGQIPAHDVMMLTHREDLLQQLRDHVNDFNASGQTPHIQLRELREYPEFKRGISPMFGKQELTVFTYRSDNLSDEQKERIIDFRNYDNNGNWYVLLDEAHKGDKEDSKRQHIYSILSRNGFLFNFSATFTDQRDIHTTAYEFNLSSFIQGGYGKHISLLKQENRAFRDKEDFTNEEKQRIVLQSLLMLAYVGKSRESLTEATNVPLYHRPLLLTLVNSVNTEDADLKLFFRELERIGKGEISTQAFTAAKSALGIELGSAPEWLYEGKSFALDEPLFNSLTINDVLKYAFNAGSKGDIEVLVRPSNDKELAFKLKTSAAPFALIKIGQTTEWLKDFLAGYEIVRGFQDESFFAHLNEEGSEINLLMGSRSFYEGWDSNRPNVITFINIGTGAEARKFVLQSVGRGVRIEPIRGKRKRLENLHNAREVGDALFDKAKSYLSAVQSLFIFGTNRSALATIFEGLEQEKEKEQGTEIALALNEKDIDGHLLLIPTYLDSPLPLVEQEEPRKFELRSDEFRQFKDYVEYLGDERLLLAHHDLLPQDINLLQEGLKNKREYFATTTEGRKYGNINLIFPRLQQYFKVVPKEFNQLKPLEDEINHFRKIRVLIKELADELQVKIRKVLEAQDPELVKNELKEKHAKGEIDIDTLIRGVAEAEHILQEEEAEYHAIRVDIRKITNHYYIPLIMSLSPDDKNTLLRYAITVKSEIDFLTKLEEYLSQPNNRFKEFDWWMFSKLDQTNDKVYIPYYNRNTNAISSFFPDFIFWLQKGKDYYIIFVDPKGTKISDYEYKVDGYVKLFSKNNSLKVFKYSNLNVCIGLALYTHNSSILGERYREFWIDSIEGIFRRLDL